MKSTFNMKRLFLVVCICCFYHRGESIELNWRATTTTTPPPETTLNYNLGDGCWRGKCIEIGKCVSPGSTALEPTGSCGRKHGTWVCCLEEKRTDSHTPDRNTIAWLSSSSTTPSSVLRDYSTRTRSPTAKPNHGLNTRSTTIIPTSERYIHIADYWGNSNGYGAVANDDYFEKDENVFGHGFGPSSDAGHGVDYRWYDDDTSPHDWNNGRDNGVHRKPSSSSGSDGCKEGRCVMKNECNIWSSTIFQATGQCAKRSGYGWVCCKEGTRSSTSSYTTSTTTETPYRSSETPYRTNHWNWKKTSKSPTIRTTAKPKDIDGCIVGTCMKPENCTFSGSVALAPTGLCGRRRMGQWVCCHRNATGTDAWEGSRRTESPNRISPGTGSTARRTTTTTTTATPRRRSYNGCGIREGFSGRSRRALRRDNETPTDVERLSPILSRIVGGNEAEPYSWPWMAALFKENTPGMRRFLCAGSLINNRYILSAAHVFSPEDIRNASSFIIRLGTHTGSESFGEYRVKRIKLHPEYQHRYYYNDISILELEQPVDYNHFVFPVCLPPSYAYCTDSEINGMNVTVTGWGDESFGGKSSGVLKEATFPIVARKSCNSSYVEVASSKFPKGITEKMLCAGAPAGGKDACQGDSGGPLVLKEGKNWIQVGVVSFGYRCGDSKYPGVYTKVGYYVDWIVTNANIQR